MLLVFKEPDIFWHRSYTACFWPATKTVSVMTQDGTKIFILRSVDSSKAYGEGSSLPEKVFWEGLEGSLGGGMGVCHPLYLH